MLLCNCDLDSPGFIIQPRVTSLSIWKAPESASAVNKVHGKKVLCEPSGMPQPFQHPALATKQQPPASQWECAGVIQGGL